MRASSERAAESLKNQKRTSLRFDVNSMNRSLHKCGCNCNYQGANRSNHACALEDMRNNIETIISKLDFQNGVVGGLHADDGQQLQQEYKAMQLLRVEGLAFYLYSKSGGRDAPSRWWQRLVLLQSVVVVSSSSSPPPPPLPLFLLCKLPPLPVSSLSER